MKSICRISSLVVLMVIFISPLSAQDSSLVGFWTFDDLTGLDSSIYGNNGVLPGNSVFKEGMKGSAMYFDGVDDNIFIWDANSLDTDSSMTISLWIMPDSLNPGGAKVMSKWYSAPSQGDWILSLSSQDSCGGSCVGWYFGFANYGVYGRDDGWFSIGSPHVDYFLRMGEWNFITVTFDTGLANLYYNGDLINTDTGLVKYTSLSEYETDHIYIGRLWNGYAQYNFNGVLDEIRIYNRALIANEVKALYDQVSAIENTAENIKLPEDFELLQNYPNPFNPKTVIGYRLSTVSEIELSVYSILGEEVATLVSKRQTPGFYQVEWDASQMASGVYFYKLITDNGFIDTKKLLLIR